LRHELPPKEQDLNTAGGNVLKLFLSLHGLLLFIPLSLSLEYFRSQAQMLLMTSVAIIIPALFHYLRPPAIVVDETAISLALAFLLIIVYILSLVFSLHTHKELFRGASQAEAGGEKGHAIWNLPMALTVLGIATVFIACLSEILWDRWSRQHAIWACPRFAWASSAWRLSATLRNTALDS
jgi:calcium/proton exchanger cax